MTKHPIDNSDAYLLALGRQLEEIEKRQEPLNAECHRLSEEAHDYASRVSGWDPEEDGPIKYQQWADAFNEMGERNGFHDCERRLQAIDREEHPVLEEILSTPAATLAGLRVKVHVTIKFSDLWCESRSNLDWDQQHVRSLLENLCNLTGVPVPKENANDAPDTGASQFESAALN